MLSLNVSGILEVILNEKDVVGHGKKINSESINVVMC